MTGYKWNIFISYRRNGNVRDWVCNHFAPRLHACLIDELEYEPKIFIDQSIDIGSDWPSELTRALQRSQLLLAVWSPSYFTSRWCLAEWQTMRRREQVLRACGLQNPLIYPIRFSDGDRFPPEARNVQQEVSFKDWRLPYPQFEGSPKYLDFHQAMIDLAERLAPRFDNPPAWQSDWPTELPNPQEPLPAKLPRL